MHDISAQSSMYIPISGPPIQLPAYVCMDGSSQWHTAGLLSIALESVTLPSRLRANNGQWWVLNDFEAALNVNGNQRIARLECSLRDPKVLAEQRRERGIKEASTADQRTPVTGPGTSNLLDDESGLQAAKDASLRHLDIDFFAGHSMIPSGQLTRIAKERHVFGHTDSFRGDYERPSSGDDGVEAGLARKRRRIAGLPLAERSVIIILFTLLFLFFASFTLRSMLVLLLRQEWSYFPPFLLIFCR